MTATSERVADVVILVLVTLYACYASFHVIIMWQLRRNFLMALRSPRLACICGVCRIVRACWIAYYVALWGEFWSGALMEDRIVLNAGMLIVFPAYLVGSGALIAWVVRLLVLYDPRKRKTWGRYVKERDVASALCWAYVGMEAAVWVGAAVFGLERTAVFTNIAEVYVVFLFTMASAALAVYMRNFQDVAGLSRDASHLAAYMMASFVVTAVFASAPGMPELVHKYWGLFVVITSHGFISWTINVKPVREFLRNTNGHDKRNTLSSWVFVCRRAGNRNTPRVACSPEDCLGSARPIELGPGSRNTVVNESPLGTIMGFPPLKEAFGEYCQRALCSESFQFLVDASEYRSSLHGAQSDQYGEQCHEDFLAIVRAYIKDNSNSEINISSRTKQKIRKFEERSSYASLDMEGRDGIFLEAEREIAKMLAENVLGKFKATGDYKEIAGELLFETK